MTMTWIRRMVVLGVLMGTVAAAGTTAAAQSSGLYRVRAHDTDVFNVWVSSGWHRVEVNGDNDTDLDLYVSGDAGLLAVDDDDLDYCVGRFYMPRSGYVQIRVKNLGRVYNQYRLSIN